MAKPATIYDVAEKAGVSIATVSRVLNTWRRVTPATREKVKQAMKDLDFVPKTEAVVRARKEFTRVGVLSPWFTEPSFVQRLRGIESALPSTDIELITYSVESYEQLDSYLKMFSVMKRIDGLITLALPLNDEHIEQLLKNGLPTVSVETSHPLLSSVVIDDFAGGKMAAEYLLSKGYANLAFIGDNSQTDYSLNATNTRMQGFKAAIESNGQRLEDTKILFHPLGMEYNVKAATTLLQAADKPDAIFTASDLQAVGVMTAARRLGLRVPTDIAVLGFDNIDLADYMGISTIDQNLNESGRLAMELILEKMKEPKHAVRSIQFGLQVIERDTT